uniref:SBBP repeat-containing protein n=3 Tax=Flavobacterium sp. TaxID=239 RepID=UPI004049E769
MKLKLLIFLSLIFGSVSAQNFEWAHRVGGTGAYERGYSVTTDPMGNVITVGTFAGTVDFDPSSAVYNLIPFNTNDLFISKYDTTGKLLWARNMGGSGIFAQSSITSDAIGNIYLVGSFWGTLTYTQGGMTINAGTSVNPNAFITKLDSTGNFLWTKQIESPRESQISSITIDNTGNIITTGYFRGTTDFDPSEAVYTLSTITATDFHTFVLKLNSSGDFVWVKEFSMYAPGSYDFSSGVSVTTDASGNVYSTGIFSGTIDFDPGINVYNLTSAGGISDVYISKLDAAGNFAWAKRLGGSGLDYASSITTDYQGNVYTAGYFQNTVDFDPNAGVFNINSVAGSFDVFISKLDPSGNFIWAKTMGGSNNDSATSIVTDPLGYIYFTGSFEGVADFDPSANTFNMTSAGSGDVVISKLDDSGSFLWSKRIGSSSDYDEGKSISLDNSGNIFVTGYFGGTADFNPNEGIYNLTSSGGDDAFILKLSQEIPPTTTVEALCAEIITSMSQRIYFESVPNAQEYTFNITNTITNVTHEIITTNRFFRFSDVPNYAFNTSYNVKGKVKVNGVYGPYGTVCTVNTPVRLGRLRDDVCNQTIEKFNGSIKSISVTGASDYRFKIVNGVDEQEIETSSRVLPLLNIENIAPNTVYQVSVAVKINDIWSPYGEVCNITTPNIPTITLRSDYCGGTVPSLNNTFKAQSMSGVTLYRFKTIIDGNEVVLEKTSRFCRMNEFAGATINQTYSIQVAIKYYGFWGAYGDACNWTVGTVGTRLIAEEVVAITSENFNIKAYPNPFVNQITLSLSNENTQSDIMVYDMTGKLIQQVSTEQTSVEIGNNWSKGIYLVQIVQGQETKNIRIVKH